MARHLTNNRFDIAAYDRTGRRTVVVEVKRRLGTTVEWAESYRRNLGGQGFLPASDFFLLVTPDRIFIWGPSGHSDARPTYEFDARSVLRPYFEQVGVTPEQIEPMAFELLVSWWLQDLARTAPGASRGSELLRSGLLDALAGAEIEHEALE